MIKSGDFTEPYRLFLDVIIDKALSIQESLLCHTYSTESTLLKELSTLYSPMSFLSPT